MTTKPRSWVKAYLDHYLELARNTDFDLYLRIHFFALSKGDTANRHVHLEPGEIRRSLEVVNKRTGDIGPARENKTSQAITRAVEMGLLAPGSNARCLVLPTGYEYGMGNPAKDCDRHATSPAKGRIGRNLPLGREVTSPAKGSPNAVTSDDASALLDVSHEEDAAAVSTLAVDTLTRYQAAAEGTEEAPEGPSEEAAAEGHEGEVETLDAWDLALQSLGVPDEAVEAQAVDGPGGASRGEGDYHFCSACNSFDADHPTSRHLFAAEPEVEPLAAEPEGRVITFRGRTRLIPSAAAEPAERPRRSWSSA